MNSKIYKTIAAGGIVCGMLIVGSFAAYAEEVAVHLTGNQEVPPTGSAATGDGTISIGKDKMVSGTIKTSGLHGGTVAHIHLGALGKNGPPIITLVKSGEDTWKVPENSALTDEQYKSFEAGELYVNVHSEAHKGGEIRAQLKP